MTSKCILLLLLFTVVISLGASIASATSEALDAFNQEYGTNDTRLNTCTVCHGSDIESLNPYGLAYQENNSDFAAIESSDSDGDGFNNLDEISSLTFPGDPEDYPGHTSTVPAGPVSNATDRVSNATERVDNATDRVSNATERVDNATDRISNATERVDNATDRVSNATERVDNATERVSNATDGQPIPGFEAVLALAGMLMAIYLFRRR